MDLLPLIYFDHRWAGSDFLRRAFLDLAAIVEHNDSVTGADDGLHGMLDHEYRNSLIPNPDHQLHNSLICICHSDGYPLDCSGLAMLLVLIELPAVKKRSDTAGRISIYFAL